MRGRRGGRACSLRTPSSRTVRVPRREPAAVSVRPIPPASGGRCRNGSRGRGRRAWPGTPPAAHAPAAARRCPCRSRCTPGRPRPTCGSPTPATCTAAGDGPCAGRAPRRRRATPGPGNTVPRHGAGPFYVPRRLHHPCMILTRAARSCDSDSSAELARSISQVEPVRKTQPLVQLHRLNPLVQLQRSNSSDQLHQVETVRATQPVRTTQLLVQRNLSINASVRSTTRCSESGWMAVGRL